MGIYRYAIKRIIYLIPVLFALTFFTFIMVHAMPGDPIYAYFAGDVTGATEEMIMELRHQLGLDKPLHIQYIIYLNNLLHGNFGWSLQKRRPVLDCLIEFFPATFELAIISVFMATILGIFVGIISAIRKDSIVDHITRVVSLAGISTPIFWLGLVLQIVFYAKLKILPISGRIDIMTSLRYPIKHITGLYTVDSLITGNWPALKNCLTHIILPASALSFRGMALIARMTRSSFLDIIGKDYIRTLRAYGISERTINFKYVLKNAFIPVITIIGLAFGGSLQGTFLVETIFDWPGMGLFITQSIVYQDYSAILGVAVTTCIIYVIVNLIIDIFYLILDPRIEY